MADFLNLKMGEKVFLPKKTETAVKEIATLAPSNSLPLAFTLHDKDKHAVVYLENPAILKSRMVLTVTNSAAHQISFNPLNGNKASANAFHFALHFRPGTISEASVVLGSQPSGWSLQTETRGDGSYWIYVLSTTARTLNPQDSLSFDLQKLLATPELGARGARVALVYRNLVFTGEQTPLKGTRTQHLSLVHRGVNADLPVHLGFVGSNTILNAGNATNSLTLRLTNLSNTDIIFQMPEDSGRIAPTKLILSFDATGEWALGDLSEINAIDPKIQGWVRQVEEQGLSPRWIFTPQSQKTLAAQSAIEILIGNIRSSKPAGLSNLHLQYENLPDYTDGHLVAAIQKTALVERNGTMEFGGTEFKINGHLTVNGKTNLEQAWQKDMADRLPNGCILLFLTKKDNYEGEVHISSLEYNVPNGWYACNGGRHPKLNNLVSEELIIIPASIADPFGRRIKYVYTYTYIIKDNPEPSTHIPSLLFP